jgi:hypothetical protein
MFIEDAHRVVEPPHPQAEDHQIERHQRGVQEDTPQE